MSAVKSLQRFRFEPSNDLAESRRDADIGMLARRLASILPLSGVFVGGLIGTDGRYSDGIAIAGFGSVNVPHGLGRPALGFIVADQQDSPASIVRTAPTTGMEDTHIGITSTSASATRVKLWVF